MQKQSLPRYSASSLCLRMNALVRTTCFSVAASHIRELNTRPRSKSVLPCSDSPAPNTSPSRRHHGRGNEHGWRRLFLPFLGANNHDEFSKTLKGPGRNTACLKGKRHIQRTTHTFKAACGIQCFLSVVLESFLPQVRNFKS